MSVLVKVLTGAAGLAAVVGFASPAAAQYYPGYGYGSNSGGGVVGAIISSVIGGGQYGGYGYNGGNTQQAVQQCAAAVEQRLGGGYGNYGGGYGGYNQSYGGGRVVQITHADRHAGGTTKVKGLATSGSSGGYGGGYGYNQGYGGGADLSFNCRVDYRGRIISLDVNRRGLSYGYDNGYYRGY